MSLRPPIVTERKRRQAKPYTKGDQSDRWKCVDIINM